MTGGSSSSLATIFRYELLMLVRDRRTVIVSILLPTILMPIMLLSSRWNEEAREERMEARTYRYAVRGTTGDLARELITAWDEEKRGEDEAMLRFEEVTPAPSDPSAALAAEELHFVVEGLSATEAVAQRSEDEEQLELPVLQVLFRADWDPSQVGANEMIHRLDQVAVKRRLALLEENGFPVDPQEVAALEPVDVATEEEVTGSLVGRFATLFTLLFLLTGGSVVAADTLAGEKERGTLETILTTATSRGELVLAKALVILAVGLTITLVQLLSFLVYVGFEVIELPESFAVDLSPLTLVLLLLLFLPLAAVVASVLLLVSGYSKTYKEFQLYFTPVFLLALVPASASLVPGLELRSVMMAVPVANLSLAVREVLVGEIDVPSLAVAWLVSTAFAAFLLRRAMAVLSTERLITASEIDRAEFEGGARLFPRHVLGWFAVFWVVIWLAITGVPFLAANMRFQVLFDQVVVFLGGSLFLVRRYRLDVRAALALRGVPHRIWPLVLVGAPAGYLAANALVRLATFLFPVPERLLEEASRLLVPDNVPFWQLVLLIAVLPGICEELAFRGVLLHGLRRRFRPPMLCLVVGGVFALFHFDLMRMLPVGFMGVLLAALTLLTGSVLPAVLWHALSNAVALVAARSEIAVHELDLGIHALALGVLGMVFVLLWRWRTPYPELPSC